MRSERGRTFSPDLNRVPWPSALLVAASAFRLPGLPSSIRSPGWERASGPRAYLLIGFSYYTRLRPAAGQEKRFFVALTHPATSRPSLVGEVASCVAQISHVELRPRSPP